MSRRSGEMPLDFGARFALRAEAGAGEAGGSGGAGGSSGGGEGGQGGARAEGGSGEDGAGDDGDRKVLELSEKLKKLEGDLAARTRELAAANAEAAERKALLQKYGGLTPDEAVSLLSDKEEREKKDREAQGKYEEQLQHERSLRAKKEKESADLQQQYERTIVRKAIVSAAAGHRPLPASLQPLSKGGQPQIVVVTEDLFEFDKDSGEVFHKVDRNEDGSRVTPEQFFAGERTKSLAIYFASGMRNGAGAGGGEGDAGSETPIKIRKGDANSLKLYEEAKKAGKGHLVEWVHPE